MAIIVSDTVGIPRPWAGKDAKSFWNELRAGTLVTPMAGQADLSGNGYYLVVSNSREAYPPFTLFRAWLLGAVRP